MYGISYTYICIYDMVYEHIRIIQTIRSPLYCWALERECEILNLMWYDVVIWAPIQSGPLLRPFGFIGSSGDPKAANNELLH